MGEYTQSLPVQIGSNRPGPHPSSTGRPVDYPDWHQPTETGYTITSNLLGEPFRQSEPFKVVMMGAGAAGIDFLHHATRSLEDLNVEIKCFDKNPDVGGTWYENRYPGCACDGPSPSYQFAWRPNPDWSHYYCGAPEIWQYMKGIVLDEGLDRFIQLQTKVVKATWDENKGKWRLVLIRTDGSQQWEEECDIFLNGTGFVK